MNEHDLFKAIGSIDEQLLQSETSRRRMRPLSKVFFIAAMIAVLSISAMAAPTVYNALKGGDLSWNDRLYADFPEDNAGGYQLFLDLAAVENAPETLEQPYILTALLGENIDDRLNNYGSLCGWYDDSFFYWCGAYRFEQYVIDENADRICSHVRSVLDADATATMKTYADMDVLEIIFKGESDSNRQLFWSDGNYIFYLMLPLDADADQILSTMTVFTDVEEHLNEPSTKPAMLIP